MSTSKQATTRETIRALTATEIDAVSGGGQDLQDLSAANQLKLQSLSSVYNRVGDK